MPKTGRSLIGMLAGFKSERWPVFDRNSGRLRVGIRKLLKIGAQVRVSVRRIKVAMASACPYADEFALAHAEYALRPDDAAGPEPLRQQQHRIHHTSLRSPHSATPTALVFVVGAQCQGTNSAQS
ncbi:hypothetical protein MPL1032_180097 [Mesorhizobium plurifarium]|uniref:Transposase DDE domain-containing protein n=1 Tax=Mesorhizobium plurifarium TaxID=69974 RepID=A0A0K2VTL3_MESPL|nr:hypothetical protein MPL1032_180097 [Mesorhizobium plurifarium]